MYCIKILFILIAVIFDIPLNFVPKVCLTCLNLVSFDTSNPLSFSCCLASFLVLFGKSHFLTVVRCCLWPSWSSQTLFACVMCLSPIFCGLHLWPSAEASLWATGASSAWRFMSLGWPLANIWQMEKYKSPASLPPGLPNSEKQILPQSTLCDQLRLGHHLNL